MAANGPRWAKHRVTMRAEIGGYSFNDVVGGSFTYGLNEIPTGVIQVGVGRRVDTQRAATIHSAVNDLRVAVAAKVYCEITPEASSPGDDVDYPDGEFLIFEGKAVGTGWARNEQTAQFMIHMQHWLADLHYSSSLSSSSHPGNPMNFTVGGSFNAASGADPLVGAGDPAWTPMCREQGDVDAAALQTDLWGEALQPWLVAVAKRDRIDVPAFGGLVDEAGVGGNDSAVKALQRIAPLTAVDCYVPLALEFKGADGEVLASSIASAFRIQTLQSWFSTTIWAKLIGEFAPAFFFALVPRVENALVVPFTPGLRDTYTTILAKDYSLGDLNSQLPQLLKAVGILYGPFYNTGANLNPAEHAFNQSGIGGWFEADVEDGLIMLKDAPAWLSDPVQAHLFAAAAAGVNQEVIGMAFAPGEGQDPNLPDPGQAMQGFLGADSIMGAFAHQWYMLESLKGRAGEISGRLRFDIAPGSTVKIETMPERFVRGEDGLGEPLFATVLRTTIFVNCEQQRAGTSFSVAHMRNAAENEDDKTSIDKPPLYQQPWLGCSLVDQ